MDTAAAAIRRDVIVVGAGLAGSAAATVLARRGLSVAVIDPYAEFPPLFRAEKIEPDQAALLQSLGLFDAVRERTRIIREIVHGRGGRVVYRRKVEQFGISYCDTVNQVRAQIPKEVEFKVGRVEALTPDAEHPQVVLADGTVYEGRLVIVASGMNGRLPEQLGAQKHMVHDELSMVFGFMLERSDGEPFPFESVTYRPDPKASRVDYVTLFLMGQMMRVNVFAYWPARDATTRELLNNPTATLARLVPGLDKVIGAYVVKGKVEPFRIDLYRMQDCARPGMVLIGDSYQSVCPSTGMGQSKVLTDVDVLCNAFVPKWLAAARLPSEEIAAFYAHPRKAEVDDQALSRALSTRQCVVSDSLQWRLRRMVRAWRFAHGV